MTGDYIVFGLGDSSYEHYNAMGKFFLAKLQVLGGKPVYKYGQTDAQKEENQEEDFIEWKKDLWTELIKLYDDGKSVKKVSGKVQGLPYEASFDIALETGVDKLDMLYRQFKEARKAKIESISELR